jgi:S1-C subfamily serine protease
MGIGFEPEFTLVGARVLTVVPGSPAAKTLQVGDVILSSDGHPIRTPFDVSVYVGGAEGTKANLVVKRGNAELKLQLDRVMMNL